MPSGKKSKQARRAAAPRRRPSSRRAASARRQANPRVLAIAGGVVVLVVVGIGLAIVLSGGGKQHRSSNVPTVGTPRPACPARPTSPRSSKGIPQNGMTLGYAEGAR